VQEIIEKPFLKAAKGKKSKFHGAGREDINARCLGWRPFVIEVVKPVKRRIDLKKIEKLINKNKQVKVKGLKPVAKDVIVRLKTVKIDKTYRAEVDFASVIDKKKLKQLKKIVDIPIIQKTPLRVVHRRADKFRKRLVKNIKYRVLGKRKLELQITGESGLYIKELINGDEGRTEPNISELLDNKVKKISLDVIKIHTKGI
jgi:tRNA pseudouridine synthase 10